MQRQGTDIRREQIVEAVLAIIATNGIAEVTAKAVAERVGFSPAALYRHFNGKEAILGAVVEHMGERLVALLDEARSNPSPLAGLRTLLTRVSEQLQTTPGLPFIALSDEVWNANSPANRARLQSTLRAWVQGLGGLFVRAQQAGEVHDAHEPRQLALGFIGLYFPAAVLSVRVPGVVDFHADVSANWERFERSISPATPATPATRS